MNIRDNPDIPAEKLQGIMEEYLNGLKIFNLIKTSTELEIFDFLKETSTCEQLSKKIGIEPVLTVCLLEVLVKLGLVEKTGDLYGNTKLSNLYLNSKSDYKWIKCILSLEKSADLWNNLQKYLKKSNSTER